MTPGPRRRAAPRVTFRQPRDEDLLPCVQVWSDSIADYVGRLNQPWFGGDFEPLRRLLAHFAATDPERFVVATPAGEPDHVVGFGSASLRASAWFLGMLFVQPKFQGAGVGRAMLERILPPTASRAPGGEIALATATDSVQPISNALYSRYGMVPRLPVFNLVGRPERGDTMAPPPPGIRIAETDWQSDDAATETADLAAIDRATLGFAHSEDHGFLRTEGRRRFIARSERGDTLGYGYIAPYGRFGPVAATDAALLAPIAAHMLRSVQAPGAYASWIPGAADELFVMLLRAGFRFESFPTLLLWDRQVTDFSRYVPINLALL